MGIKWIRSLEAMSCIPHGQYSARREDDLEICMSRGRTPREISHKMSTMPHICIVLHNFPKHLNNVGISNHKKCRESNSSANEPTAITDS